jgi:acyl carrier protein
VTRSEIEAQLREALGQVAPEADLASLDPRADLREQLEIDSMDFLNFVIAVHARTGVEIASLDAAGAYLSARLEA